MAGDLVVLRHDGDRDRWRRLVRIDRAHRRWAAYEHACGRAPARGPCLQLRPQARRRSPVQLRDGQAGRSCRLHQCHGAGHDRYSDRLRSRAPPVGARGDRFRTGNSDRDARPRRQRRFAWLLASGGHDHGHGHHHGHAHAHAHESHHHDDEHRRIATPAGVLVLSPSRTATAQYSGCGPKADSRQWRRRRTIETLRPDGARRTFALERPRRRPAKRSKPSPSRTRSRRVLGRRARVAGPLRGA